MEVGYHRVQVRQSVRPELDPHGPSRSDCLCDARSEHADTELPCGSGVGSADVVPGGGQALLLSRPSQPAGSKDVDGAHEHLPRYSVPRK